MKSYVLLPDSHSFFQTSRSHLWVAPSAILVISTFSLCPASAWAQTLVALPVNPVEISVGNSALVIEEIADAAVDTSVISSDLDSFSTADGILPEVALSNQALPRFAGEKQPNKPAETLIPDSAATSVQTMLTALEEEPQSLETQSLEIESLSHNGGSQEESRPANLEEELEKDFEEDFEETTAIRRVGSNTQTTVSPTVSGAPLSNVALSATPFASNDALTLNHSEAEFPAQTLQPPSSPVFTQTTRSLTASHKTDATDNYYPQGIDSRRTDSTGADSRRTELSLSKAQSLSFQGDLLSSVSAYAQILAEMPNHQLAKIRLAQTLSRLAPEQWDQRLSQALSTISPESQLKLAETLTTQGAFTSSVNIYQVILSQNPNHLEALRAQAEASFQMGDEVAAISYYQSAITHYPNDEALRSALAQLYLRRQQIQQAIEILQPLSAQDLLAQDSLVSQAQPEETVLLDRPTPPERPDAEESSEIANEPAISEIQLDFRNENKNSFIVNQFIDATTRFRLGDSDGQSAETFPTLRIGYNDFHQTGIEGIINTSIQLGIEQDLGNLVFSAGGGIDFFDRLPAAPNASAKVTWDATDDLSLYGDIEYGAYKFNADTLDNEIRALRITPSVFWQIDGSTSLFSSFTWGHYSDGNQEQQLFTSLERTFGDFFVGASLFYWHYRQDLDNGYFDPDSFLFYEGEIGWDGQITNNLSCRISVGLGEKKFEGDTSLANAYQARCELEPSEHLEISLGYEYITGVADGRFVGPEESAVVGQVRFTF